MQNHGARKELHERQEEGKPISLRWDTWRFSDSSFTLLIPNLFCFYLVYFLSTMTSYLFGNVSRHYEIWWYAGHKRTSHWASRNTRQTRAKLMPAGGFLTSDSAVCKVTAQWKMQEAVVTADASGSVYIWSFWAQTGNIKITLWCVNAVAKTIFSPFIVEKKVLKIKPFIRKIQTFINNDGI